MKKYALLILALFVGWVMLISIVPLFAYIISEHSGYIHPLYRWANFDGIHYLSIAEKGYTSEMRFMPLFPVLISGVTAISHHYFWSAFLIVYGALAVAIVYMYKLFRLDYTQKQSLLLTAAILTLPTSFFFGMIYTESIFLMFSILALYFARKGKGYLRHCLAYSHHSHALSDLLLLFHFLLNFLVKNKQKKFIIF